MSDGPDFLIIGAMKCATSSLHDQLAAQPGVFMSEPKEPCYFSDDAVFARGEAWYRGLFAAAKPGQLCGESSTHYTKLPTHPHAVARCHAFRDDLKLIYVMRHPMQRLVSQYIHEWTMRLTSAPIDQAVEELPILVDYSRYAMQLEPWFEAFGQARVLPVFFERLTTQPQAEFERIGAFLGLSEPPTWFNDSEPTNASAKRLRVSPWRDAILEAPILRSLRRNLVPQGVRNRIKSLWTMQRQPKLSPPLRQRLEAELDAAIAPLGEWVGRPLTCATWTEAVTQGDSPDWARRPQGSFLNACGMPRSAKDAASGSRVAAASHLR